MYVYSYFLLYPLPTFIIISTSMKNIVKESRRVIIKDMNIFDHEPKDNNYYL